LLHHCASAGFCLPQLGHVLYPSILTHPSLGDGAIIHISSK
jgi:hypothetical protein